MRRNGHGNGNVHGSGLSDTEPLVSVDAIYVDEKSPVAYLMLLADKDGLVNAGWYRRVHRKVGRGPYVIRQKISGPFKTEAEALS